MAVPRLLKYLSGVAVGSEVQTDPPAIPLEPAVTAQAILQLQNTVNELIVKHNALCTATTNPADAVTGAGASASSLFTAS